MKAQTKTLLLAFLLALSAVCTHAAERTEQNGATMNISIAIQGASGEHTLTATLADNKSARAFAELLQNGAVTVTMHDYGGFEKVGDLPKSLPRTDTQITTEPGDIILYAGKSITIYYDTNSWNFTRLGKVRGVSAAELRRILGAGGVTATFSLAKSEAVQ